MFKVGIVERNGAPTSSFEGAGSALDEGGALGSESAAGHRAALSMVEVPALGYPVPGRDWPAALRLVERAADRIRDYEAKFVAIEQDARTFVQRVADEQRGSTRRIAALERRIAEVEKRAAEAEAALDAAKLANVEMQVENRDVRTRLDAAEAELRKSGAYIRKVEDLLGGF